METNLYLTSISDLVYTIVLLALIHYIKKESKEINDEYKETQVLPSKYTLEVYPIPKGTQESDLKEYFNEINEDNTVHDVQFARDYKNTLYLFKDLAEINI